MDFAPGQTASIEKTFTEEEVRSFSAASMDDNPIHLDEDYAAGTRFKSRIVQGPNVASLIGGVLGSKLPGPGTIYMNQATNFLKPVFIGDRLRASVSVLSVSENKKVLKLRTWVEKIDSGEVVIDGEATVLFLEKL